MSLRKLLSVCKSWIQGSSEPAAAGHRRRPETEEKTPVPKERLRILITGCSSGFGELFAKTLCRQGHHVFASMRGVEDKNAAAAAQLRQWAEAEGAELDVVELDVTDQESVDKATASIEESGSLDVVINNAGWGGMGIVEAFSIEQMRAMFEVNTFGAMRVDKAVLPAMRRRRSGLIIHVSSTAGRIVIPGGNPYIATKFALEALAESLHHQLAPFGVDAIILEPGYYPTTSFDQKKTPAVDAQVLAEYAAVAPATRSPAPRERLPAGAADPQEVADAIERLIDMPQGARPLRTVVGSVARAGVDDVNAAYEAGKRKMLKSLGS